jgi:exopolyphosphatase / guanosine-5'-triphosphate,3'-diphosphate pyrophosphatase
VRIAAIDIGTNSVHMVIAEATSPAAFEVVGREREVVQIGRESFADGRLRADAIRRTVDALARFVQIARRQQVDSIVCTATAAVREARNGGEFLTACRKVAGVTPRVIPAEEEGRLIYLAVKSALQLDDQPALMVDIGGGSMQLVVGSREKLALAVSAPLGALRLTEQFLTSDPPGNRELQRLRRHVRKHSREALERVIEHAPQRVYGSSGSIHALAQVAHWFEHGETIVHINGHVLTARELERVSRRLARMTVEERERVPGVDAKRAEIILPGALVLEQVLDEVGADAITVSDFGVREGLVTDYITAHAEEITSLDQVEDVRLRSVLALLKKFNADGPHPRHVAKLALALFDQLKPLHGLDAAARELLHYAALLHDVGAVIGYDGHAEHSYYIIRNGNLRGLTADEVDLIAHAARYHSKTRPRRRHKEFRALAKPARRTVRWLAALLRIAEGLDRSHYQLIRGVRAVRRGRRVSILVSARREARLEIWAARRRVDMLSRLVGGKRKRADAREHVWVSLEPAAERRGRRPPTAAVKRGAATTAATSAASSAAVRAAARAATAPPLKVVRNR